MITIYYHLPATGLYNSTVFNGWSPDPGTEATCEALNTRAAGGISHKESWYFHSFIEFPEILPPVDLAARIYVVTIFNRVKDAPESVGNIEHTFFEVSLSIPNETEIRASQKFKEFCQSQQSKEGRVYQHMRISEVFATR